MTIARLRPVNANGVLYDCLQFWCPGCERVDPDGYRRGGLHMLPVNTTATSPSWDWDGNLEAPTLAPSILSRYDGFVCHSFIRGGMVEFLSDCTHALAGQTVPLGELPEWTAP